MPHVFYRSRCRDVSEYTGGCVKSYELKTSLIVPSWLSYNAFWYRKLSNVFLTSVLERQSTLAV